MTQRLQNLETFGDKQLNRICISIQSAIDSMNISVAEEFLFSKLKDKEVSSKKAFSYY
ncbi:hypothetical protein [Lacinutrix sp.]|uniref:hypothetical protein n=1 Tax=Lacinutrix sp. TaxID=1937692 RepID=UPI0025C1C499|nr:hypothetical protein [Lacinutrix sp.]